MFSVQSGLSARLTTPVKLLLVEDDKKIATAVKRGLEAEGFTVEVSFDGDDGFWQADRGLATT